MSSLTPLQQRFVELLVDAPLQSNIKCVVAAGYKGNYEAAKKLAQRWLKQPLIIEARMEAARARLQAIAPLGIAMLEKAVRNTKAPNHQKAIDSLLDRAGLAAVTKTETHTTVEHKFDRDTFMVKLAAALERTGLNKVLDNPAALNAPAVIDAAFEEVDPIGEVQMD